MDDTIGEKILDAINLLISAVAKMNSDLKSTFQTSIGALGDRLDRRIDTAHSETFVMSKMSIETTATVLRKLSLLEDSVAVKPPPAKKSKTKKKNYYTWGDSTETQQQESYAHHLETRIPKLKGRVVPGDKKAGNWKLDVDLCRRQLKLVGYADLLFIRAGRESECVLTNVHVALEAKKVDKGHVNTPATHGQAIAQLIALDHHAKGAVVTVATDLHNTWMFFWLALCPKTGSPRKRQVLKLSLTTRARGLQTLDELLDGKVPTYASFSCDCGGDYESHLTKFADMEAVAAEELAEAGHLDPDAAPADESMGTRYEVIAKVHRRRSAGQLSCVHALQGCHVVDSRSE